MYFIKTKNRAKNTLKQYNAAYKYFTNVIDPDTKCRELDKNCIIKYINYFKSRNPNVRNTTINTYLRPIKAFLYYLMEEELIKRFKISLLPESKISKDIYTDDELMILLKKPNLKKCTFVQYRNWVLVNYLLATGNRLRTVVNLKVSDIDFDNNIIHLRVLKCNNQYSIPLSNFLKNVLSEYLRYMGDDLKEYLFPTASNKKLSEAGLHTALANYNRSLGVKKTSTQVFRHTFARKYHRNGGEIPYLRILMGHNNIQTTLGYLDPSTEDIKDNINSINPLDKLVRQEFSGALKINKK